MAFQKDEPEQSTGKCRVTFKSLCDELAQLQADKQTGYNKSPIDELPLDVWLAQVQIKATRAKYATTRDKLYDELRDTAVYALLCMQKMSE